ncbi:hypothetical protein POM88_041460 [Heracleum sosnowskyi]|uniref:Uncharacterized protein n=1 Tax=Heracleum sosnowskyi TaxID=360622 RepID=A0AAD8MAS5_9APIA|nr:hypothetical protein POM88_041460 [Heracleum sosnowskyi]
MTDEQSFREFGVEKERSNFEEEIEKASTFQISETNSGKKLNSSNREKVRYKEVAPMLEEMYVGFGELEILHQDSLHVKTEVGMPVLKARSSDDIRSALGQLDADGTIKKPNLSENTYFQFGESEILPQDPLHVKTEAGMPVLEAHSLDDIRLALA